jgi:hypothetical protein
MARKFTVDELAGLRTFANFKLDRTYVKQKIYDYINEFRISDNKKKKIKKKIKGVFPN